MPPPPSETLRIFKLRQLLPARKCGKWYAIRYDLRAGGRKDKKKKKKGFVFVYLFKRFVIEVITVGSERRLS